MGVTSQVICEQRAEWRERRRDSKSPRLLHSPRKYDSEDWVAYHGLLKSIGAF